MPGQERTSTDVRSILRSAIESGVYAAGESLPSSRELAAQFGINRNTANKIYRELADEGLVMLGHNRPPYVMSATPHSAPFELYMQIKHAVWKTLHEGRLRGVSADEIRKTATEVVDEFISEFSPPEILVSECNWADAERYSRELSESLEFPVRAVLLADLHGAIDAAVVVTPVFHLEEARAALGANQGRAIGFLSTPMVSDVMRVIARMERGPIGVVAGNPAAVDRLTKVLSFHVSANLITATSDDPSALSQLVRVAEVVACTARCKEAVDHSGGREKAVTVRYHVDPDSLAELRQRLVSLLSTSEPSDIPDIA